jgi:hypothetical protein
VRTISGTGRRDGSLTTTVPGSVLNSKPFDLFETVWFVRNRFINFFGFKPARFVNRLKPETQRNGKAVLSGDVLVVDVLLPTFWDYFCGPAKQNAGAETFSGLWKDVLRSQRVGKLQVTFNISNPFPNWEIIARSWFQFVSFVSFCSP